MDTPATHSGLPLPRVAPGARVAGYRVEAVLGEGGMAVVYRARDESLRRTVALKVLTPALASDKSFRKRFLREARAASAIDHPHIIPVYAADEAGGVLFIAMRLVTGGDLSSLVEREGPLPADRAAGLIRAAASALDAVHQGGLVHRDVKPSNILLDGAPDLPEQACLSDFGLAKAVEAPSYLTDTGQFLGTPAYAAPEQIMGGPVDSRCDQYALAGVAVTLLTAAYPYPRQNMLALLHAQVHEPPPSVCAQRPDLPAAVDEVIARAMAKSPADRFASCGQFAASLAAALGVAADDAGADGIATNGTSRTLDGPVSFRAGPPLPTRKRHRGRRLARHRFRVRLAGAGITVAVVVAAVVTSTVLRSSPGSAAHAAASSQAPSSLIAQLAGDGDPAGGPVSMAFGQGNTLLAGCGLAAIDLWNLSAGLRITPRAADVTGNSGCALSPDGRLVATSGFGSACVWTVPTQTRVGCGPELRGTALELSSTGVMALPDPALSGATDVWNAVTGTSIATVHDPDGRDPQTVALSPDGTHLATLDGNGNVRFWDVGPGKPRLAGTTRIQSSSSAPTAIFSADGTRLAIDTTPDAIDYTTYVLDVRTRAVIATLPGVLQGGLLAISPDGTVIAEKDSTETDLVDAGSGRVIQRLDDRGGQFAESAVFSSDGTELAVYDNDAVYLWRLAA